MDWFRFIFAGFVTHSCCNTRSIVIFYIIISPNNNATVKIKSRSIILRHSRTRSSTFAGIVFTNYNINDDQWRRVLKEGCFNPGFINTPLPGHHQAPYRGTRPTIFKCIFSFLGFWTFKRPKIICFISFAYFTLYCFFFSIKNHHIAVNR